MSQSRYSQARTLVRRLCRQPDEDRANFRLKIARLREHFERFNDDASKLCQWFMRIRRSHGIPDAPQSFGIVGDYLLNPGAADAGSDESTLDHWRCAVFDEIAGLGSGDVPDFLSSPLRDAARLVAAGPRTPDTVALFQRLGSLQKPHRLVLLKAAAEWIVARYQRGMENWTNQRKEWQDEKNEWESRHPVLTSGIRTQYTDIFKGLLDPERDNRPGLRKKNPRICPFERMLGNNDNCCYAGEKGHGPLCWKYAEWVKKQKEADSKFNNKRFWEDAERFIRCCIERNITKPANLFQSPNAAAIIFKDTEARGRGDALLRFKRNWSAYLKGMNLNDVTAMAKGRLPHCQKIGSATWENSKCQDNPHTQLCNLYRARVAELSPDATVVELLYREWRKAYLAGPRRPSFRYPSSRDLPMPKIFGAGFFEVDLERSVLRLRLEGMAANDWLEFGFIPWPRHYPNRKNDVRITSIHVNFIGSRARAGLRFDAPHKPSRFGCTQDEIDRLRSQVFPRRAHDQQFLDAARTRLLETSNAPQESIRLLAVDLGEKGAHASVYHGRRHHADEALAIIKIDELYDQVPASLKKDVSKKAPQAFDGQIDTRGLRMPHVRSHLASVSKHAAAAARYRQEHGAATSTLRESDLRGLNRHVRWMIRDWVRHNAAQVIAAAERHQCDIVVFESLRPRLVHSAEKRAAHDSVGNEAARQKLTKAIMSFGAIRHKVREKAVERGMRVVTVPDYKSSRTCSACGRAQRNDGLFRKNKKARIFRCEHCRAECNSDANAARVLARVFWGEIQLPVETTPP